MKQGTFDVEIQKELEKNRKNKYFVFQFRLGAKLELIGINFDKVLSIYQMSFLNLLEKRFEKINSEIDIKINSVFNTDDQLMCSRSFILPQDNSSKWQWSFETTNEFGPTTKCHFYFDGWDIDYFESYSTS